MDEQISTHERASPRCPPTTKYLFTVSSAARDIDSKFERLDICTDTGSKFQIVRGNRSNQRTIRNIHRRK